jgi:type IV pilus assembly protein PilW
MNRRTCRRQRGVGIAELLVSMALGPAVLLAAGALLVSANGAYASHVGAVAADEGGRYALEAVVRAVRQASYVDWDQVAPGAAVDDAAPARLGGLDAHTLGKTSHGIANPLADAINGSDVLAVRFAGAGRAPDGDGSALNCAGFPVHGHEEGWSIFYVARDDRGEGELRCKYQGNGGWSADAVVGGVDSFQVLYGVDTDTPADGVPNRYVNASAVDALDAALVLSGANAAEQERDRNRRTHWKRIASVQFALLLHGARARVDGARIYDLFGPDYGEAFGATDHGTRLREGGLSADGGARERRVFAATVALRHGAR